MRHNPGGIFGSGGETQHWQSPPPPRPRPIDYSYRYESNKDYGQKYETHKERIARQKQEGEERKQKRIESERITVVSQALWCDMGNHAFSAADEERQRLSQSSMVKDPDAYDGKREVTTVIDVCGPCWNARNPFRVTAEATPVPEDEVDNTVDETAANEEYLRGFKDGMLKGEIL